MGRDLFGQLMGVDAEEKKEEKRVRNRKLRENVPSDIGSRSKDLQIVNQLVDTSKHSVGVDRSEGKRTFVKRPTTVGYRVKNVSEEPVEMKRRIYKAGQPDEDGRIVYTCTDTDFILQPGESVDISKYDAGRLFGRTEFGFTARNGYFTGSKGLETSADLEEFYSTRYFVPTTPLSERSTVVINAQIGMKDVSDEFIPVFAFLMETKKPKRQKVSSRCQLESLALAKYLEEHSAPEAVEASSNAFDGGDMDSITTAFGGDDNDDPFEGESAVDGEVDADGYTGDDSEEEIEEEYADEASYLDGDAEADDDNDDDGE